jgi:hypothetical protein
VYKLIHRAKTARAACNTSMQADGGVPRCSYCDSSDSVILWAGGSGTAGYWKGQIELRVTNGREVARDCGINGGAE